MRWFTRRTRLEAEQHLIAGLIEDRSGAIDFLQGHMNTLAGQRGTSGSVRHLEDIEHMLRQQVEAAKSREHNLVAAAKKGD